MFYILLKNTELTNLLTNFNFLYPLCDLENLVLGLRFQIWVFAEFTHFAFEWESGLFRDWSFLSIFVTLYECVPVRFCITQKLIIEGCSYLLWYACIPHTRTNFLTYDRLLRFQNTLTPIFWKTSLTWEIDFQSYKKLPNKNSGFKNLEKSV